MIEKNPVKVASTFDELILNPLAETKKPVKIVENMEDMIDLIQIVKEAKKQFKLKPSLDK